MTDFRFYVWQSEKKNTKPTPKEEIFLFQLLCIPKSCFGESLSWTMSFVSTLKVSICTHFPLFLPILFHLHWDHKLLNTKPCFQSVRCTSQCQGPWHPPLHLWRHLCGKLCLHLCISLSVICTCIIQALTHHQNTSYALTRPHSSIPMYCYWTFVKKSE